MCSYISFMLFNVFYLGEKTTRKIGKYQQRNMLCQFSLVENAAATLVTISAMLFSAETCCYAGSKMLL